jgi:hypothetical protein
MPSKLTVEQRKFLKAVRETGMILSEVLGAQKLDPKLLMRWLRRNYFRRALNETRVDVRRRMLLEIDLLSQAALATWSAMQTGKIDREEKALSMCKMIRDDWFRLRSRYRRSRARHRIEEPQTRTHPNFAHEDEEMTRILEANRRAAKEQRRNGHESN